jgi:hypothetical protein
VAVVVAGEGPSVWNELAVDDDDWDDGGQAFEVKQDIDSVRPWTSEVYVNDIAVFLGWEGGTWI